MDLAHKLANAKPRATTPKKERAVDPKPLAIQNDTKIYRTYLVSGFSGLAVKGMQKIG